jgi:lantibiotic leader peptide-processing serine protease
MRIKLLALASIAACAVLAAATGTFAGSTGKAQTFVVVYDRGASAADARAAIERAGGSVIQEDTQIGYATVRSSKEDFLTAARKQKALDGAARNRVIGRADRARKRAWQRVEQAPASDAAVAAAVPAPPAGGDPLSGYQWDMQMIHATPQGSYAVEKGTHDVRVGIIDTGIDGSHPDIAPNFNGPLSRNFTTDDPIIDGSCESDPDHSCADPADVDEDGHGTHVAGTVASPLNGIGIAGVAPGVELVNLRAGQDSGFFFIAPTVAALRYAGDNGIDVVNMSFYIDPWLYNCTSNVKDSPEDQAEQAAVIELTQRAIDYARDHGVTTIAAEGNGHTDLGDPKHDNTSPDYPPNTEYPRNVDNSCLSMPTEADGVIGVTSVGPSGRKAYYSDYGLEQADVAAPGGDRRDTGTGLTDPLNRILAPYPKSLAIANGQLNPDGTPNTPLVVADCTSGTCSYYQWLQGTSMASPHAVGVAALIVSHFGTTDAVHGGKTLSPITVERILKESATDHACPPGGVQKYPGVPGQFDATCEGTTERNGFYGEGIVDALAAVTWTGP